MRWIGAHPFRTAAIVAAIVVAAFVIVFASAPQGSLCPASPWWSNGECFEWWVNRYQTLIAALIVLFAALLVVAALRERQSPRSVPEESPRPMRSTKVGKRR